MLIGFLDDGSCGHVAASPAFSLGHCGGFFMQSFEPPCRRDYPCGALPAHVETSTAKDSVSSLISSLDTCVLIVG